MPESPSAGDFLVASEVMTDPNFAGSVVLLCEHDEEGSLGLVMNRPLDVKLAELLPDAGIESCHAPIYWGGPVKPDALHALKDGPPGPDAAEVYPGLAFGGQLDDLVDAWQNGQELRFFLGYSGWSEGQLEEELSQEAWKVVRARPTDVFAPRPDALWGQLMSRVHPAWRHLRHQPTHPDLN